jgi:hypothetical protein
MGETNYPAVAHVGYDISPLSRVKFDVLVYCFEALLSYLLIIALLSCFSLGAYLMKKYRFSFSCPWVTIFPNLY